MTPAEGAAPVPRPPRDVGVWVDAWGVVALEDGRWPPGTPLTWLHHRTKRRDRPETAPLDVWAVGCLYDGSEAIPEAHFPCPALRYPDDQSEALLELWHVRVDVPESPLYWEGMWRPSWPTLRITELRGARPEVPPEIVQRAWGDPLYALVGLPRAGRRGLLEMSDAEHEWRQVADKALTRKQAEPWLTWPIIADRIHVSLPTLEKYLRLRRRELGAAADRSAAEKEGHSVRGTSGTMGRRSWTPGTPGEETADVARTGKYVGPLLVDPDLYARLEREAREQERDPLSQARWIIRQALSGAEREDAVTTSPRGKVSETLTAPVGAA